MGDEARCWHLHGTVDRNTLEELSERSKVVYYGDDCGDKVFAGELVSSPGGLRGCFPCIFCGSV